MNIDKVGLQKALIEDLYFFARYAFNQRTKSKWLQNWHHQEICDTLQKVYDGEIKRLIINIPPRYSKTEIAVKNFAAWCLAQNPDCEFIHASYSATLAANNSAQTRDLVASQWYQELFQTHLDSSSTAKDHWKTTSGGVFYSSGAGGTITGFGAGKVREGFGGAIIIDDPHKADEANSEVMRKNVIDWYQNTIASRVNNPNTPIIIIMQRLHEDDLCGWLLRGGTGEEWYRLNIPVLNSQDEPLWIAKHSREELTRMETTNPYVFAGQYMQRPAPLGGGIFKDSWWQYYNPDALPHFRRIIASWDTAFKAKEINDASSGTIWGEAENGFYLLDRINVRAEYPELKRKIQQTQDKWQANTILIEDKASGQSLIQDLKQTRLPIVAIKVDSDKVTRAFAVTGIIEAGKVFLPNKSNWVIDYIAQMGQFPNGKHDDDVDSTTQALNYMQSRLQGGLVGRVRF